jgi:hypothetical protein
MTDDVTNDAMNAVIRRTVPQPQDDEQDDVPLIRRQLRWWRMNHRTQDAQHEQGKAEARWTGGTEVNDISPDD